MNAEGFLHANNFMLRCAFAFRQLLQRHVAVLPHLFCGSPLFELRHDVSLSHWVPGRIIPASPSGLEFGRDGMRSPKKKLKKGPSLDGSVLPHGLVICPSDPICWDHGFCQRASCSGPSPTILNRIWWSNLRYVLQVIHGYTGYN